MTKPPYDPDKLPPDLQAMIPNYPRRPTFNPTHSASASLQNNRPTPLKTFVVTPRYDKEMVTPKSYAQVAVRVSPLTGGGLKPMRRKRRNPLTVRLSDNDRDTIRQKAKTAGCTLNAFVRASLLGSGYKAPKDPELLQALRKLSLELTRQGVNLNQLTRQINSGQLSCAQAEPMIAVLVRSTLQIHKAIRQAMANGNMGME